MHEISIALDIVDTLEENGYLKGVVKVAEIKLTLGKYSGIDKNYLSFAFQNLGDVRFKDAQVDFSENESGEITIKEIIVD